MAISVVMPALELAQDTGKVLAWRKHEGDSVIKGEPLLDIETDKAVVEVEAPGPGILAGISARAGDEVPVGRIIAWVIAPGESIPSDEPHGVETSRAGGAVPAGSPVRAVTAAPAAAGSRPRLSPKARRLAQEHGIDADRVRGTGPGGEVLASDIEAAIQTARQAAEPAPQVEPINSTWKLMAERTTASWSTVPHFFLVRDVDASTLVEHRVAWKARGITYTDVFVALVARVLLKHPRVNAAWTSEGIRTNDAVHIGVAVASDEGVVVAVVRDAARSALDRIAAERLAVIERARAGRARPADLAGATFTISNLGMRQVDSFTAIINPPQAAILAVGSIVDRVVAIDGRPVIRPMLTMTLSSDHRVIDGARAAAFMDDVAGAVGDPDTWLN